MTRKEKNLKVEAIYTNKKKTHIFSKKTTKKKTFSKTMV